MEFKTGPFVKWAGGKKQLLDRLEARMPATYGRYYEPFIGGGALLLDLQPERAVINDTNEHLLNVYRQLKIDAEAVIAAVNERLDAEPCDKERYMATRDVYNAKIKAHELDPECAALMIWITVFGSFQDLLGTTYNGGIKAKNKFIHETQWDIVIFDEYHFGAWREKAQNLFAPSNEEQSIDFDPENYKNDESLNALDETFLPIASLRFCLKW